MLLSLLELLTSDLEFNQIVTNLDLSRKVDFGLAKPVNVAFGAEARFENYVITAGEPDSWRDGGSLNQFGTGRAVPGAQVFPGFRPSNELDKWRHNLAAYLDVEGDVFDKLREELADSEPVRLVIEFIEKSVRGISRHSREDE